jgi:site-specific DNA-methyltransferase (adenine-specific)
MVQKIINSDYIEVLASLPSRSVHLCLQDLPYGVTKNKWDKTPDLGVMWRQLLRVGVENAAYLFTAQQPFATDLIVSNRKMFKYDLVWCKGRSSGFLNAKLMPLRQHEMVLVFYQKPPTYNPQFTEGTKNHSKGRMLNHVNNNYGSYKMVENDLGTKKYPTSILTYDRPHPPIHSTQKPIGLFSNLIKTFSNEGDMVFDGFSGSGTTAVCCLKEGRNAICCEADEGIYLKSVNRYETERSLLS